MPKVSILSHHLAVVVSLIAIPTEWKLNDWLLDESGFPWEILAITPGQLLLKPIRGLTELRHPIGTLAPIKESIAFSYLNRVFDYISRIEALDLTLKSIRCGDWFESWGENEWVMDSKHDFKLDTTVVPRGMVLITDCNGIEWGPLPCDPTVAPATWPFRGGIKSCHLTFTPTSHGEGWLIKMYPFQIDVQGVHQLRTIVLELKAFGWLDMVQRNYPEGLILSKGHGNPSATPNITEEDLNCG